MKKLRWILLFCLICLASAGREVQAQENGWSSPVRLSSEKVSAWFPDIVADPFGRLHVAWSQATGNFDNVMYTSSDDGEAWTAANDIIAIPAERGSEATRPRLVADDETNRLVLFYRYNQVFVSEADSGAAARASAWKNAITISTIDQVAYYSDAAIDETGKLHALVTWNVPSLTCEICYHVFYRSLEKDASQWSVARDISILDHGAAKPSLQIDQQGILHAIWEASDEGGGAYGNVTSPAYLVYTHSFDGGSTWTEPLRLDAVGSQSRNPALAQDGAGRLVMTWLGLPEDKIYYRLSADGGESWSTPRQIPGVSGGWDLYNTLLDGGSMAVDASGNLHLVLVGRVTGVIGQLQVLHLTWDGDAWLEPDVVSTFDGDVPEWPRIAISGGNVLNVVWTLRDEAHVWDTENGNYTIWYAELKTTATAIKPRLRPTSTATPEAAGMPVTQTGDPAVIEITETAIPAVTISPTTTVPPDYIPGENAFYKEMDYLKLIAAAMIPAALFIGLIFLIIFVKRSKKH